MPGHALEAVRLSKHFGPTKAVDGLSLAVDAGEVVGFLGPNGAGKTTTLRLLLGLLHPTSGTASILGHRAGSAQARRAVAYVPGEVALWPQLTGLEVITLLGSLHGEVDVAYRDDLVARFELDPAKRIRAYSKGNRQKVALISAFSTRAPVLLLDEPTAGLDPLMERIFRDCVLEAQARGQAILLSSHILAEVQHLCERVAMIRDGRLVTVSAIDELREVVGVEIDVAGAFDDLTLIPGVSVVSREGDEVRVRVIGPIEPLLAVLARGSITSMRTHESSLEEIFLSYYDESRG
ncbi:MAG: ABC transporter ATP-binding protein [Acidimicrobiales bacterium]